MQYFGEVRKGLGTRGMDQEFALRAALGACRESKLTGD